MIEGSPSVVIIGETEVARGEISVDAGRSLSIRIDEILGELPVEGDEAVVRTFEAIRGRREYVVTVDAVRPGLMIVTDIELISAFQERAIVRVPTDLHVSLTYEFEGDEIRETGTAIPAIIIDLSATGLRLFCTRPLDDYYRFGFDLATDFDQFTLVAESLRREDVPRGYLHGCRLIGTSQREADALHRYVLSAQIAQRRRTNEFD
ncbi:PilZ domain-containing protein [Pengzhenrongella sicca]|uniref:PilZ domain-containing protein n=1 Tax=Pengzhenrongella sicca TaxID=2819238 RepID=A0A8A4ZDR7_9MICO|nr:PilZ domain-containing protein [Pengzhenrongella sicca]QTE27848.1 PilZ domain-containing protein [Pengzhenrongella sicca]